MNRLPQRIVQQVVKKKQSLFNQSFFKFMFSFVAVVAGVLLFILVLGVGSGVQ